MFEQIINDTASRLGVSTEKVSALVHELLALMTNERTGGVEGFVDRFRRAGLGDIFTSWFGGREGAMISASQVEAALGANTLDSMASASGLTRGVTTSGLAMLLPAIIGRLTPGGSLPTTSALLSQIASFVRPAAPAVTRAVESRRSWGWMPWAAAAVLALVAWLFLRGPSGTIDPQLVLHNRDGKVTYSGLVRDESTRTTISEALRTGLGEANVTGDVQVDENVKRLSWLPRLDNLLAVVRRPGVDVSIKGDSIALGGWLSAADRETLTGQLQSIFGAQTAIGALGDAAADAVRTANDQALSALNAIGTTGVSADSLGRAMNLAIINFASGSAEIPADSMDIIRKAAEAMRRAPNGTTIEINGHTDNTGDSASNLTLSQHRAEAVKDALVAAGAPAEMLTAKGYGDTSPRAPNDTEYGRFQNRRIEYTVH